MPKGICYNASRQERRKCSLWHAKSPGGRNSGAFLFRCGKVAYSLGWLPPIYLRPAICRCSRRLHLPRQRVRKTKIYSWWHTPFLYLCELPLPCGTVVPMEVASNSRDSYPFLTKRLAVRTNQGIFTYAAIPLTGIPFGFSLWNPYTSGAERNV